MSITKAQAVALLAVHGFTPTVDTATVSGVPVVGTSFLAELGDHETYNKGRVMDWLGY